MMTTTTDVCEPMQSLEGLHLGHLHGVTVGSEFKSLGVVSWSLGSWLAQLAIPKKTPFLWPFDFRALVRKADQRIALCFQKQHAPSQRSGPGLAWAQWMDQG